MKIELSGMFSDPRFRRHGLRQYSAEIDGRRIGVVLATKNPGYNGPALNKIEFFDRLLAAKRDGRIDVARVVFARTNGDATPTYWGEIDDEELEPQLRGITPRSGRFGEFYVLPDHLLPPDADAFF
jgi:hypothetical protein